MNLSRFLIIAIMAAFVSCTGKDKTAESREMPTDNQKELNAVPGIDAADSSLAKYLDVIETGLVNWMNSFPGFRIDSFHLQQKSSFTDAGDYEPGDPDTFFDLYKASLVYSPDSSRFLDLFSSGVMLERKGKKIMASADVDQSITLNNLKTREWKSIAFFGPSAGIEEAVWVSPSIFILAGTMYNDDGAPEAFVMIGNTEDRSFQWFESGLARPTDYQYESSLLKNLKIDEWE